MKRLLVLVLLLFGFMAAPVLAGGLGPVIPKATGEAHPEGNLFMRINHMNLMKHDRDETVLKGDREISYSLKACVDCHAVNGDDGAPVSVKSEKHFCRVCHDFAAVKVDCFQCHNSKPQITTEALLKPELADANDIATYLKEAEE
jgi:hypothetical protein